MMSFTCAIQSDPNEEDISKRRAVFLDMNIWIDLRESSNPTHVQLREKLRTLVSGGHCFCPLSTALLLELLTQEADSALRVAALMDELSLGCVFH